jgi:hypothetical protein
MKQKSQKDSIEISSVRLRLRHFVTDSKQAMQRKKQKQN